VSKPQQGGKPHREGPARKRRRKRKSKSRNATAGVVFGGEMAQSVAECPVEKPNPGEKPEFENRHRDKSDGEDAVRHATNRQSEFKPGRSSKRRHRTTKRDQTIRNLRSPVKPIPPASLAPPAENPPMAAGVPKRWNASKTARARYHALRTQSSIFAALDLGTNNCRLLVAVPAGYRRYRVIDAFSRIVRLGEGLHTNGRLSEEAMQRAIDALKVCAAKLASYNLVAGRLIATEACRHASNGMVFLDRVKNETGLVLEIVDRETEARLAAEGCGELMDRSADGAVLFDIGGGSSELILVDRRNTRKLPISGQISAWTSLPLGVVTLSERHGGREVSRTVFDNMVEEVLGHLNTFDGRDGLAEFWGRGRTHLLGTSGTVTTIAGVHLELPRYDRRRVDGMWLSDRQIDKVIGDLLEMNYEKRAGNPCIGHERADLVMAGCAILQAIRMIWPSDRLRVADRGLREGILSELMSQNDAWGQAKHDNNRQWQTGSKQPFRGDK
jgi:exopolyphosphatase / guanosine-5'-triphosphate,3'-diphosphate pyrophosphatase